MDCASVSNVKIGCLLFETCSFCVEARTFHRACNFSHYKQPTLQDTDFQFFSFFCGQKCKVGMCGSGSIQDISYLLVSNSITKRI
jgi:hypothetical protein